MTVLTRLVRLPGFLLWFIGQMIHANAQVAWDLLTPGSKLHPAIVAYRPRSRTPSELTALSNLITLTPGTLTVDLSTEEDGTGQHVMYILGLYAPADPDDFRGEIAQLEDRMLSVLRAETKTPASHAKEATR